MHGSIRSASLTNFAEVARSVGLDPHRMLSEFGLPPRTLVEPELIVPVDTVRQLLEVSAARSGLEGFGLRMAETRQLSALGPLGLLIREQPTFRAALEAFVKDGKRLNEALYLTIEESGEVVVLREELIVGRSGPVRQATELAIGVAFRVMRAMLGPRWLPRRVCFAHDAPHDRSVHDRVFGCTVEFGHDFNGIVCLRRDLDAPNPNADAGIARLARKMLEQQIRTDEGASTEVRDIVVAILGKGCCTIDRAAQHLGVDRRTIHRRLEREGTTFTAIVEEVRRELAQRYIEDRRRTLTELSSLLGFSAPSAFSRWYRRAFNQTAQSQHGRTPRAPR